ncbi:MAG: hypothetical protein GTN76_16145 [Candidatus Aenigmarchaeota archaeon]|nr:hypothetical protein [Candidatus Aenigmarchaeota archaeon]
MKRREFLRKSLVEGPAIVNISYKMLNNPLGFFSGDTDIFDRVSESGYRSLASKTFDLQNYFERFIERSSSEDLYYLGTAKIHLNELRRHGRPLKLDKNKEGGVLKTARDIWEQAVPGKYVPRDGYDILTIAVLALTNFFKVDTVEKFVEETGIKGIKWTNDGMSYVEPAEKERIYNAHYNPEMPVTSVIVNIHELYHLTQKDITENAVKILRGVKGVEGYSKLSDVIWEDEELYRKALDVGSMSHFLNFLLSNDIMSLAKDVGVNTSQLRAYLKENIPRLDIINAVMEGEAYNAEYRLLDYSEELKGAGKDILNLWRLIALYDVVTTPILNPHIDKYVNGIGLGEMLWDKKELQREIVENPDPKHVGKLLKANFG